MCPKKTVLIDRVYLLLTHVHVVICLTLLEIYMVYTIVKQSWIFAFFFKYRRCDAHDIINHDRLPQSTITIDYHAYGYHEHGNVNVDHDLDKVRLL